VELFKCHEDSRSSSLQDCNGIHPNADYRTGKQRGGDNFDPADAEAEL
jgi:hypothetical protein